MKFKLKNIFIGLLVTLISPVYSACSSDDNGVDNPSTSTSVQINISPESIEANNNAQIYELTITANVDWSIMSDASWVSIRPSGGIKNEQTIVKVNLEANKDFDSRSTTIKIIAANKTIKTINVVQGFATAAYVSESSFMLGGQENERTFIVTANADWTLTSESDWITVTPGNGGKGDTNVTMKISANEEESTRNGNILLTCGETVSTIEVTQLNYNMEIPEGYDLVWSDEFDIDGTPGSEWVIENQGPGWVNNELQTYTSRQVDGQYTLEVKDGFLHINCFKASDGKIYSGRMNARPGTGWTYGYFEARINLPKGKGTWPAFWMMPSNVDWNTNGWPHCGEIDIMEEVGVDANRVSSSIHTGNYNHTIGTQKTHEMYLAGAEGEFHVYALEWTEDSITTFVDGQVQLSVKKSDLGSDHESWPFHYAFYPILNLAWGGDWGGYAGVDESALPVTMLVDYVRVFQKR